MNNVATPLESPIIYPTATVGGKKYTAKVTFLAQRRMRKDRFNAQAIPEPTNPGDDATPEAVAKYAQEVQDFRLDVITANISLAPYLLGTEQADGTFQPINMSQDQIEASLLPHEAAPLSAAIVQAWNLAREMSQQALAASQTIAEPTTNKVQ